jgi:predicted CXXCH cytochrome family protein
MRRLGWLGFPAFLWVSALAPQGPPSFVVAISGEMDGNLTPCGCSKPMLGGLPRRANLFNQVQPVIRLENGDLTKASGRQDELKAETAVDILNLMKYDAVNLGEKDFALGMEFLRSLQARFQGKILCANAMDADGRPVFNQSVILEKEFEGKKVKVAVVGLLSESLFGAAMAANPQLRFEAPEDVLEKLATRVSSNADIRILLYHGPKAEAESLARKFKTFQLMVCAHDTDDPSGPYKIGDSFLVSPGKDGKHLTLATFNREKTWMFDKAPDRALDPDLGENEDAAAAMAAYEERIAAEGLLAQVGKSPSLGGASYVGTEVCGGCHTEQKKNWQNSKHAHAMPTLIEVKHDRDPECVSCHVVGLTVEGGYVGQKETPHLQDVGCESCHGPGSKHVANSSELLKANGEKSCLQCHIPEHSPKFDFKSYWEKIKH